MALIDLTFKMTGEEAYLRQAIDFFAMQYGWTPEIDDGNGKMIPNPVASLDFGAEPFWNYLKDSVVAQINKQANQVATVAADEMKAPLENITFTMELK